MSSARYLVAQLGARMHYAVPRILHESGMLERLFTDICATTGWPRFLRVFPQEFLPARLRRLAGRVPQGIPPSAIMAFNTFGLNYARQVGRAIIPEQAFLDGGKSFCKLVLARNWGGATAVYTFNSAGLEIMQAARERGLKVFMEQTIAPKRVETELLQQERAAFPGWETGDLSNTYVDAYAARELAEWRAADVILCGSKFVRDGIGQCGGSVEKCKIVPYGVDHLNLKSEIQKSKSDVGGRPLRVLTVGSVGLRKGSPYVLAAAKRLKGKAAFRMVGGIGVTAETEAQLREHVDLSGVVPRSEIAKHFAWADVFLLPSLCEGSATVTYEAMAHGLPVICTPNTGSVVRDGVEGFIVPVRDVDTIVDRLEKLRAEPELRDTLAANARSRAAEFTVAAYGQRLLAALKG